MSSTPIVRKPPLISTGVLGILIFIASEIMFFASLVSSYLILRMGATEWPPLEQPRLPAEATAFNTAVLVFSAFMLWKAQKVFVGTDRIMAKKFLSFSILLGGFFLFFQGYEWMKLVHFGLTLTSSTYGAIFYLVIGSHALHVLAGLLGLCYAWGRLNSQEFTIDEFKVSAIFWYFVVGLWPLLYFSVYIL